jgi:hypothetical protein
MKRRSIALAVALLVALAFAAWYFASPAYTLSRMKSAAEANDSAALSAYIDFPALREDLKSEIMAQVTAELRRNPDAPFAGIGMAMAGAMVGPVVDGMISPAGLRTMFTLARPASRPAATPPAPGPAAPAPAPISRSEAGPAAMRLAEDPVIVRRGLSEFLVASRQDRRAGLVFRRHGLSWKLSGVDLAEPQSAPAGSAR